MAFGDLLGHYDTSLALNRWLRHCLWANAERECRASSVSRLALFPGGEQSKIILRYRWPAPDLSILAVLDESPVTETIGGVPVVRPEALPKECEAIVVTSDQSSAPHAERVRELLPDFSGPIIRVYNAPRPMPV